MRDKKREDCEQIRQVDVSVALSIAREEQRDIPARVGEHGEVDQVDATDVSHDMPRVGAKPRGRFEHDLSASYDGSQHECRFCRSREDKTVTLANRGMGTDDGVLPQQLAFIERERRLIDRQRRLLRPEATGMLCTRLDRELTRPTEVVMPDAVRPT
jgi:hypothetical protein